MKSTQPNSIPRTAMGGGQLNEDDLIEHILQNPTPSTLSLEEVVKETKRNHQSDLCLVDSNATSVKTIEFVPERTLKINPSFCTPRRTVVQHAKGTSGCLFLELQINEGNAPLGVYSPHLYQRKLQTSLTTPKENEPNSQVYSQGRTTKVTGCRIHLPYLRQ